MISPHLIAFLRDLKDPMKNDRDWFAQHKNVRTSLMLQVVNLSMLTSPFFTDIRRESAKAKSRCDLDFDKSRYHQYIFQNWLEFVEASTDEMMEKVDDTIAWLPPKVKLLSLKMATMSLTHSLYLADFDRADLSGCPVLK